MTYTEISENTILDWLKQNLNEHRYKHSLGCAHCAEKLAKKFNLDEKKAYLAGLLHDCAKNLEREKMLEMVSLIPDVDQCEIDNPKTLHAPISAYLAKEEFKVNDEEILSSIRWHTLGKADMSVFEKIIFLADKIEPHTRDLKYREMVLSLLEEENGLDKAILICYKSTIQSLLNRNLGICQATIDIYNKLLQRLQ